MFLAIRMALYFIFPLAAAYGFGSWNDATGLFTITVDAQQLAQFLAVNLAAYSGTFALGRVSKARGGPS